MERNIKLSPNSLNLFLECPACFWLEKCHNIKRPQIYPFDLNSELDNLLKEEFDTYRKRKELPPFVEKNKIKAKLFENQKLLNQWRNNLIGLQYFDQNIKATLFGAPDDILEFKDNKLAPLDYKSTGKPISKVYDRFCLQMDVYTFLLMKNGFKTAKNGYLAFYIIDKSKGFLDKIPFKKEIFEIKTNPEDVYEIFRDAVYIIRSEKIPEHSKDCQFSKWFLNVKSIYG